MALTGGRILTDKFDFSAVVPAEYPATGQFYIGIDLADNVLKTMDEFGALSTIGGDTLASILAAGATTSGNNLVLTNNDLIKSSTVGGSRLDFGAAGDQLNLKTGSVSWVIATTTNLVVGDSTFGGYFQAGGSITPTVNQLAFVSAQAYLYHGTKLVLDTPSVRLATNTVISDAAGTGSRIDFSATGDNVVISTDAGALTQGWIWLMPSKMTLGFNSTGYYQSGGSITPTVNQVSIVAAQTYLYHGTKIALDSALVSVNTLSDTSDVASIDTNGRTGYDSTGTPSISWNGRTLADSANINSMSWNTRTLIDSSSISAANWNSRFLIDGTGVTAVDWTGAGRYLIDTAGLNSLSWQTRTLQDSAGNTSFYWTTFGVKIEAAKYITDTANNAGVDTNARVLIKSDGTTAQLDWNQGFLYNDWKVSSGNLGVNVTPGYKFHVKAPAASDYGAVIESSGVANAAYFFFFSSNEPVYYMQDTASQTKVALRVSGDSWLTGGNVGIGIDTPGFLLHTKAGFASQTVQNIESADNTGKITLGFIANGAFVTMVDSASAIAVQIDSAGASYFNGGQIAFGTTSPQSQIDVLGVNGYSQFRMRATYTPTGSADANGNDGDVAWDSGFIYLKTAAGAWKRAALSAF